MNKKLKILIHMILLSVQPTFAETSLPDALKVPGNNSLLLTVHAKGDQIFLCTSDKASYSWKWQAPDAKLFDNQDNNAAVGSHDAGPNWTYKDGSSVKAKVIQKVDAPDGSAASWLLLKATENKGGGVLAQASYIQRINTVGGLPPLIGCDANHLGAERRVPYRADYTFYGK